MKIPPVERSTAIQRSQQPFRCGKKILSREMRERAVRRKSPSHAAPASASPEQTIVGAVGKESHEAFHAGSK
jgi:hypothetical protein